MDMVEGYGRQRKLGASQVLEVGQTQAEGREARRDRLQAEPVAGTSQTLALTS